MFYWTLPSHETRLQPSSTEDSPTTTGFWEFRASSPETREREVDVGKAPTQKVMGYFSYTTLMTLLNTWYATPTFWCHPDAPDPLYGGTLAPTKPSETNCLLL